MSLRKTGPPPASPFGLVGFGLVVPGGVLFGLVVPANSSSPPPSQGEVEGVVIGHAPCKAALGADTSVVLDGEVMGKPRDRTRGLEMLGRLSGRSHQVLTAITLVDGAREAMRLSVSTVTFRATTAAERDAYWNTGEPLGKAGGYAIQGRAAIFVAHLEGSFSGVMGLPLYETAQVLNEFGIAVLD